MTTESITEQAPYIVAWAFNNVLIRWPCVLCGGETGRQEVLAIAYAGSQSDENEIGMVCDECMDAGPAQAVARLTQHAERLEAAAAEVRRQAAASWQFPPQGQTRQLLREWNGHEPLPSTRFGASDLMTAGDLMPAGYLGESDPPFDTCYDGCHRCEEMTELRLRTVTTQDTGSEDPRARPPLPPEDSTEPEVLAAQATEGMCDGKPLEVPIENAAIQPLAWENYEHVGQTLRCVGVEANRAVAETVSVTLSSHRDPASGILAAPQGWVYFDLKPLDALALADELRRAAEESVAPCPCGRTLATMRDSSDVCLTASIRPPELAQRIARPTLNHCKSVP